MRPLSICILLTVFTLSLHAEESDTMTVAPEDLSTYVSKKDRDIKHIDLSDLYRKIDKLIDDAPQFISEYESKIDEMKQKLAQTTDKEMHLLQTIDLSYKYESFNGDSAQAYTVRSLQEAKEGGFTELEGLCATHLAYLCTFMGSQTEALTLLGRIQPANLNREARYMYYRAYMMAYANLSNNTQLGSMRQEFGTLYQQMMDSLLTAAVPGSEAYYSHLEPVMAGRGDFIEALEMNDKRLNISQEGTHENAIVCYSRYALYRQMGNMEMAKYWLCKSAIDDIRNAVMDQMSLIALAELLEQEGDNERATRYISFTWECNRRFSPHMRSWQIAPLLSAIEANYQAKIDHKNHILTTLSIGSTALILLLFLMFMTAYSRQRKSSKSEKQYKKENEQLKEETEKLQRINDSLNGYNKELFAIKEKLEQELHGH